MNDELKISDVVERQNNYKGKKCDEKHSSAIYYDFGIIKCQYCMGAVSSERAVKYIEYNTVS
jgi:hypothetical protein